MNTLEDGIRKVVRFLGRKLCLLFSPQIAQINADFFVCDDLFYVDYTKSFLKY